jgi:hypothetical protein
LWNLLLWNEQLSLYFDLSRFHCFNEERNPPILLELRNKSGFEYIHPKEIVIYEVLIICRKLNVVVQSGEWQGELFRFPPDWLLTRILLNLGLMFLLVVLDYYVGVHVPE